MIKVFLVIPNLGIGGAEHLVLELAKGLDKKKFKVIIVCLYDKISDEYDISDLHGIEVIRLRKKRGIDLAIIYRMIKLFILQRPDVVHTHLYAAPYVLLPAILSSCKKRYHTVHNLSAFELSYLKRKIMKVLYRCYKFQPVAISDSLVTDIADQYGLPQSRVILIRNGINISSFMKPRRHHDEINIISIGRLTKIKNHILILEAMRLALKEYPKLKLSIAGEGSERINLENYIKIHRLSSRVKLLGNREDIPSLLSNADMYISTSLVEGLPLSILEAMSNSLPIIATPAGGVVDIVSEGNGIVTNHKANNVAMAILRFAKDKELRSKYGKKSLEIASKFDIKIMVSNYEALYAKK